MCGAGLYFRGRASLGQRHDDPRPSQNFVVSSDARFEFFKTKQTFYLVPYMGPIMGNTRVVVSATKIPDGAASMIRCIFGTIRVKGAQIDDKRFMCISPAQQDSGELTVKITFNLQEFAEASQAFALADHGIGLIVI